MCCTWPLKTCIRALTHNPKHTSDLRQHRWVSIGGALAGEHASGLQGCVLWADECLTAKGQWASDVPYKEKPSSGGATSGAHR